MQLSWHQTHYFEGVDNSYRITQGSMGEGQLAPGITDVHCTEEKYLIHDVGFKPAYITQSIDDTIKVSKLTL